MKIKFVKRKSAILIDYSARATQECERETSNSNSGDFRSICRTYLNIIKTAKLQFLSLFLTFTITFTFYPFIPQRSVSECAAKDSDSYSNYCHFIVKTMGLDLYKLVFCFLLFNICDFAGRNLGNTTPIFKTSWALVLCSSVRFFIGLLFFLVRRDNFHGWSFFSYDATFIILMIVFCLSSGFMTTKSISCALEKMVSDRDRDLSGIVINLMITCGLFVSALLSFIVTAVISWSV